MYGKGMQAINTAEREKTLTAKQAQGARYALTLGLVTDQPLTGGMEAVSRVTDSNNPKALEKYAAGQAVSMFIPFSAGLKMASRAWDSITRDMRYNATLPPGSPDRVNIDLSTIFDEKRVKSEGGWDELRKAMPWMRGEMQLAPDKWVNAPGGPRPRYPAAMNPPKKKD